MLQNRRNRVLIAIIAVLLVLLGMLATTAFSRKVLDPDVFALGSDEMPGIGDYVSLGDLEVRVDKVDKRDAAGAREATADYRTVLGGKAAENTEELLDRRGGGGSGGGGSNGSNSGDSFGSGSDLTVIKINIRNNSDSPVDFHEVTPPTVNVQTSEGTRAGAVTGILVDEADDEQVLEPGESFDGAVVVDIPAGSDPGWFRWFDPTTGQSATADIGGGKEAPGTCEDANVDLAETELGFYLAVDALTLAPEGQPAKRVSQLVVDSNQFDPCAELSWAVVSGWPKFSEGRRSDDDRRHAVVFFTGDHLASFDAPVYRGIESVHRNSDGSVTVTDDAGNENIYDTDGPVDSSANNADAHADFDEMKTMGLIGGSSMHSPVPHGNVYSATPLLQAGLNQGNRYFRTQVDGVSVLCALAGDPVISCTRDSGTWTTPDGAEMDSLHVNLTESGYDGNPHPSMDIDASEPGNYARTWAENADGAFPIPPDSMALLRRGVLVDTRGGAVRIAMAYQGTRLMLQLDSEKAQVLTIEDPANPYNLDLSRWPDHKSREATETREP